MLTIRCGVFNEWGQGVDNLSGRNGRVAASNNYGVRRYSTQDTHKIRRNGGAEYLLVVLALCFRSIHRVDRFQIEMGSCRQTLRFDTLGDE